MDEQQQEEQKHAGGRPPLSEDEKNDMLQKLEPYLKSGLGIRKALLESGVSNGTFYAYYNNDLSFRNRIDRFKHFTSILLNNTMMKHLHEIAQKQSGYTKPTGEKVEAETLDGKDLAFLEWFATNSNLAKEEYGERKKVEMFDPQAELDKMKSMIDEEIEKKVEGGGLGAKVESIGDFNNDTKITEDGDIEIDDAPETQEEPLTN